MSSEEETVPKDGGINEVLQRTHELKISDGKSEESNKKETEKEPVTHDFTGSRKSDGQIANEKDASGIDLADPDRVLQMLETVDLSEEDTELLLQEAYNMNRQLRAMLRHQETTSCPPDIQRQKTKSKLKEKKSSASPSQSGSRSETGAFSAAKPLPPISQPTDIYTLKLKRSHTNIPVTNRHTPAVVQRSKSSKGPSRNDSRTGQSKKKPKAPEEKPDWNNRFNYT